MCLAGDLKMDLEILKKLVNQQALNGQFEELHKTLSGYAGEIDGKLAAKILSISCNICVKMSNLEQLSSEHLFKVLKCIASSVKCMSEAEMLIYLQSMFHFLKIFVSKGSYEIITAMEDILVPSFVSSELPPKHTKVCQSIGTLLHNLIAKAAAENDQSRISSLVTISNLVLKLSSVIPGFHGLINLPYNCFLNLSCLKTPVGDLENYYLNILTLAERKLDGQNTGEFISYVLKFVSIILGNHIGSCNFKKAREFLCKVLNLAYWSKIEEFRHLHVLLNFPLILAPSDIPGYIGKLFFRDCKRSLEKLRLSNNKQVIGAKLNTLICKVLKHYEENAEFWCGLAEDDQLEILCFINDISILESESVMKCPCGCVLEISVYQSFAYLQMILNLMNLSATQHTVRYHEGCAKLLSAFSVKILILKENKCQKWQKAWNILGAGITNIIARFYQKSTAALPLVYFLVRNYIKFERGLQRNILNPSVLSSTLCLICNLITDSRQILAFSALGIYLCPNERENVMSFWLRTKHKLRELNKSSGNEVQEVTLAEAFNYFHAEMSVCVDSNNFLSDRDRIDLLIFELEQYRKVWRSKVSMKSALKELCSKAEIDEVASVIAKIFGECDLPVHDDVPALITSVIEKFESSHKNKRKSNSVIIHISNLYFIHYKYAVKEMVRKNVDEMSKVMEVVSTTLPANMGSRDPNEECDVVSSYHYLTLDKSICILQYLNQSLSLLTSVLVKTDNIQTLKISINLYRLLVNIAMEYRLICFSLKTVQALKLALKVAQSENNSFNVVHTITLLIENSELKYVKDLIAIADQEVKKIELSDSHNVDIIITYYIVKAKCYLHDDNEASYRIFKLATDLIEKHSSNDGSGIVKSLLHLQNFQYCLLPCELGIEDHNENAVMKIHSATTTICQEFKNGVLDGPYQLSLLFEINEEIVKFFHLMNCPREVRMYGKEILTLAQKMVLPLRCVNFLTYLAYADVYSNRFDDCHVKLNGMADILCLPRHGAKHQKSHKEMCPSVSLDDEVDFVGNEIREMILDAPESQSCYKKQLSPSSPALVIHSFQYPNFAKHDLECSCFFCICFEYQVVVLKKTRLDALINIKQNNNPVVEDFYKGAYNLYKICSKRFERCSDLNTVNFNFKGLRDAFFSTYEHIVLDRSRHLRRLNKENEAMESNEALIDLIAPMKEEYVYLYQEALLQKLVYLTDGSNATRNNSNLLCSVESSAEEDVLTPKSQRSKVAIKISPQLPTPKIAMKKKIVFNFSPIEDPEKNHVKTPKQNIKSSGEEFPLFKKENLRTPAPTIQIYTENGTKKSTRKKKPSNEFDYTAPVNNVMATKTSVAPKTPAVPNENTVRKARTRLLTEKLKQSANKPEPLSAKDESACQKQVMLDSKKKYARKNLINELVEEQKEIVKGTRSRRKK